MNGNCHFVFGAAVGAAFACNLPFMSEYLVNITNTPETATLFVLGGLIGGIFPDIDNPVSYVGKLTAPVSTIIGKIGELFGKKGKNHRGILHDPAFYIVLLVLSYLYFTPVIGFIIGCLSHTFLDMFNPSGVPFLLGAFKLRLGKIPSGSKTSVALTWITTIVVVLAGIALRYKDEIAALIM